MNGNSAKIPLLVGKSDFTQNLRKIISEISGSNSSFYTVLIKGEKGTGKKFFAQNIHYAKSGKSSDFYELNGKLLSKTNKNYKEVFLRTFAGIKNNKSTSTLFINYLNEFTVEMQQDLLLFIKDIKSYFSNPENAQTCKLTIVSASPEDLEEKVNNNQFLPELYFLTGTVVLNTLPLRMRKDDVISIADYYREVFKNQSGLNFENFSEDAEKLLLSQFWKANVDELINCIQRAFLVGTEPVIKAIDLGLSSEISMRNTPDVSAYGIEDKSLKTVTDNFKKDYVTKILEENEWNQTKTARILGIQRTYVIKLIKDLNIKK